MYWTHCFSGSCIRCSVPEKILLNSVRDSLSVAAAVTTVFLRMWAEISAGLCLSLAAAVEEALLVCRCYCWSRVSKAHDNEWDNQALEFRWHSCSSVNFDRSDAVYAACVAKWWDFCSANSWDSVSTWRIAFLDSRLSVCLGVPSAFLFLQTNAFAVF